MGIQFIGPMVVVSDIDKSRKFYEEVLQQTLQFDFDGCQQYFGGLTLQSKESMYDFLGYPKDKIESNSENIATVLYFELENFDEFVVRLKKYQDIQYIHDSKEYEWGQRSITFYDLDQHPIDVSETMASVCHRLSKQGLTIEEIVIKTQHPLEFVTGCLQR